MPCSEPLRMPLRPPLSRLSLSRLPTGRASPALPPRIPPIVLSLKTLPTLATVRLFATPPTLAKTLAALAFTAAITLPRLLSAALSTFADRPERLRTLAIPTTSPRARSLTVLTAPMPTPGRSVSEGRVGRVRPTVAALVPSALIETEAIAAGATAVAALGHGGFSLWDGKDGVGWGGGGSRRCRSQRAGGPPPARRIDSIPSSHTLYRRESYAGSRPRRGSRPFPRQRIRRNGRGLSRMRS